MVEFSREGGFAMFFVLGFGALAMAAAVHFARSPDDRRFTLVRGLSATTLFAILSGVSANLAAVFHQVPQHPEWLEGTSLPMVVMTGPTLWLRRSSASACSAWPGWSPPSAFGGCLRERGRAALWRASRPPKPRSSPASPRRPCASV